MKNILYVLFISSILALFSCEDSLEEKVYDKMAGGIFNDSENSARDLTNGVLGILNGGDFFRWDSPYIHVAELDHDHVNAGDWTMKAYGAGNFAAAHSYLDAWWFGHYNLIHNSLYAIDAIGPMKSMKEEVKNNYLGQLWFLQGWAYFQLVQAYGPVPIYKERVTSPAGYNRGRMTVVEVYNYAIECLNKADEFLYSKNSVGYEKGRISKYAAKTMLAQVYCTMASGSLPAGTPVTVLGGPDRTPISEGNVEVNYPTPNTFQKEKVAGYDFDPTYCYTRVKGLCDTIIRSGEFKLYDNYMDTWKVSSRNGPEFIWQLQASLDAPELRNNISMRFAGEFYKSPFGNTILRHPLYGMRHHWYRLFEHNKDERVKYGVHHLYSLADVDWEPWDKPHLKGTTWWSFYPREDSLSLSRSIPGDKLIDYYSDYVFMKKFDAVTGKVNGDEGDYFYPFLRYPVVFLMLAEAENELGNSTRAKEMIDVVRVRAKASLISGTGLDQQQIRSFVLEERARELAFEGYRKWDLLRWGIYLDVMNKIGRINKIKDINKSRDRRNLLFPLPLNEIGVNPAITENNPGW